MISSHKIPCKYYFNVNSEVLHSFAFYIAQHSQRIFDGSIIYWKNIVVLQVCGFLMHASNVDGAENILWFCADHVFALRGFVPYTRVCSLWVVWLWIRAGTIQGSFDSVRFRFKTVRFGFFSNRFGSCRRKPFV